VGIVNISGFARGGLSTRSKVCRFCGKAFTAEIFVRATKEEDIESRLASVTLGIQLEKRWIQEKTEERAKTLSILTLFRRERDRVIEVLSTMQVGGHA